MYSCVSNVVLCASNTTQTPPEALANRGPTTFTMHKKHASRLNPTPSHHRLLRLQNRFRADLGIVINEGDLSVCHRKTYGTRLANKSFVAKKFQTSGTMVRNAADFAAMNLRMATMHLTGMRIPPRVRTVPSLRLRLPVAVISSPPQQVIIRQIAQNLDSPVTGTRPNQSQRV